MSKISGRPTVINEATVRKLELAFRDGLSASEACFTSGIGRTAYYDRRAADEAFADRMDIAKQYVNIKAKKTVIQAIDSGSVNAAKWWLERKARSEFGANPIDEEKVYEANQPSNEDMLLRQILDSMSASAEDTIAEVAQGAEQPQPATATVVTPIASHDVLADLYD